MESDNHQIDYESAAEVLDYFSTATTTDVLASQLHRFGQSIGLPVFVARAIRLADRDGLHASFHLGMPIEQSELDELFFGLESSHIPVIRTCQALGSQAIACSSPHGSGVFLLAMAGPTLQDVNLVELMGLCSMASARCAEAALKIDRAGCPFSPRELDCLRLAATGASSKTTARELGISHRTVEEYLLRCRKTVAAESTLAVTAVALRRGWITYDEIDSRHTQLSRQSKAG